MAVNKMRNGEIGGKFSQQHVLSHYDYELSRVDEASKGCVQLKKESRKPELQRYRPGMGLKGGCKSNGKCEESANSSSSSKINIPSDQRISPKLEQSSKDCLESDDRLSKDSTQTPTEKSNCGPPSKKNNKSRRPDQQVYTPKVRTKNTSKSKDCIEDSVEKYDNGTTYTSKRFLDREVYQEPAKPNNPFINHINTTQSKKTLTKKSPSEKSVNLSKSNSPQSVRSSKIKNDVDRCSETSSCRSTPEGFDTEELPTLNESLNFVNSNLKHNAVVKELAGDYANANVSTTRVEAFSTEKNKGYTCWGDTEFELDPNVSDHSESQDGKTNDMTKSTSHEEIPLRGLSNKTMSKSEDCVPSVDRKQLRTPEVLTNGIMEVGKNAKNRTKSDRERKLSEGSISRSTTSSSSNDLRDRNNRKAKRDKSEHTLPPRFQKQNQNMHMSDLKDMRSGGLLVVPSTTLTITPPRTSDKGNLYGTSSLQSSPPPPPRLYVHKQLFNPKNPSNPEIVNVPAPANSNHFDSPHYNAGYVHGSEMVDYGSGPMLHKADKGYIPPPQPPATKANICQYPNIDFPHQTEIRKDNHAMLGTIASPVLCPLTNVRMLGSPGQPPIYPNDYIVPPESERKRLKPIVEKNLKEISLLERELNAHLAKGVSTEDLNALRQCRWKLQLRYENIILADTRYCAEKNAEQHLWKSAYYQIIESLRKSLEEEPENKQIKEDLLNLVHEGAVFYENLLEKLQETYGFNLTQLLELENLNGPCFPESLRLVLISSQKILIYLGDLARYKEQASGTTSFGKARNWYLKAQQIAPKNGRPYHQLAVLALCARRKLDAVYYFIRSLAASNPFLSAREYLLSLFEDAKKKYERCEKKRHEDLACEKEIIAAESEERSEVWIKPDGTSSQHSTVLEDRNAIEFKNVSNVELNKRFVNSFLHVHGKLYTKIGMETFNDIFIQMLREFYHLLQRVPLILEISRLLQLSSINMYAVANMSLRDSNYEESGYPLLLIQALQVNQAMMSLLIQRCCVLQKLHMSSHEYPKQLISYDVAQLLPAIKIWSDWMSCQQGLWSQLSAFPSELPDIGLELDVWSSFAEFLSVLIELDISQPEISKTRKEGFEPFILEEDNVMSGFVPLLGAQQDPVYSMPPFDKDRAKQRFRISRIQFFGDYLCGIPTPYLEFNVERKKFISLVTTDSENEGGKPRKDLLENHRDDSFGDESLESDDILLQSSPDDDGNNEIKMLWSRKEALSKVKAKQEKYMAQIQAVLQKNQRQRPIVLQIQPRYLVPDTNCFIDHLQQLKNILEVATFHLVVPLVVINELDGLARGTRPNPHTTPEHANKVSALSRASVSFLEEQFASRNPRLRSITSKGSILDTISFRVEEMGHNKRGNNDDLILSCCLYYCKDRPEMYMPKTQDEPLQLIREVVLLTDDRNLRVKALTHNVPARDLISFLQWVNS